MTETLEIDENLHKLRLETENLNQLKTLSQQCCTNTQAIKSILSEFDDRLAKLERDIQPVYKETGNFQSKHGRLVETLDKLNRVIKFYSTTSEVNNIIRAGPANQLELYMKCLKQMKSSLEYFSQNNPDSPEHMNVSMLFKDGCDAIEKEFKLTLQRYSSPIAPITLLDIVQDIENSELMDSNTSSGTGNISSVGIHNHQVDLPHQKIKDLKIICEWLRLNCHLDLINTYSSIRSDYIYKSLKSLQDYKRAQTFSLTNTIATLIVGGSNPSGSSRGSVDSPDLGKKRLVSNSSIPSSKKTPDYIQSTLNRTLIKVIPGVVISHKLNSSSSIDDIIISDKDVDIYLTCITAFQKLAVMELHLMSSILPEDLRIPTYNLLIQESLRFIVIEANNLTMRVKKSTMKHDFASALNLFPLLRVQTMKRHDFQLLFDGCESEALVKFQGLTITFQATISNSLDEFAFYVQNYNDMKVPDDGTVHELTNNVMIFIAQLRPNLDIMSSVIPIKDMQAMENTRDKNRVGFAQYITRLLVSLSDTIKRRAEVYSNQYLVCLFKLNNYNYILSRLNEYELLDIIHSYIENFKEIYENMIAEAKDSYIKSLSSVINHLIERQESKSKSIKERFSGFNKEFQELHRLNKGYAVPDQDLRIKLRESCKLEILHYYRQFHNYYINQDFSKNKEKYIKYSPDLVESMIDQFFGSN